MKHFTLPRFWKHHRELPRHVQLLAQKNFQVLKRDPHHPSLHFKKLGKKSHLWSVRVGIAYRALGMEQADGIYWFWIGSHADYDRLLRD